MKAKVRIALIVALFVSAMFVAPSMAAGNKDTNFLFVLSSADSNKVTRCFQFAKIAHSKGYKVDIFLIDDGVIWGVPGKVNGIKALTGDTADKYLDYLVQNNVPIGVGGPCAKARQVGEDNLLPNAKFNSGGALIEMAANAKVFNFGLIELRKRVHGAIENYRCRWTRSIIGKYFI